MISLTKGIKGMKYYIHRQDPFEVVFQNAKSYQEIRQILANLPDDTDARLLKWECSKRKLDYFTKSYAKQGFLCLQPAKEQINRDKHQGNNTQTNVEQEGGKEKETSKELSLSHDPISKTPL